jgi:hypothetical protein
VERLHAPLLDVEALDGLADLHGQIGLRAEPREFLGQQRRQDLAPLRGGPDEPPGGAVLRDRMAQRMDGVRGPERAEDRGGGSSAEKAARRRPERGRAPGTTSPSLCGTSVSSSRGTSSCPSAPRSPPGGCWAGPRSRSPAGPTCPPPPPSPASRSSGHRAGAV